MSDKRYFHILHNLGTTLGKFNRNGLICLAILASLIIGGTSINSTITSVSARSRIHRVFHVRHNHCIIHRIRRRARRHVTRRRGRVHYRYSRKEFAVLHNHHDSHQKSNRSRIARRKAIAEDGNNNFARETAKGIYYEINAERKQHGLRALPINTDVQKVADQRNNQVYHAYTNYGDYRNYAVNDSGNPSNNWIHGADLQDTSDDDAQRLGISDNEGTAENAGNVYVRGATRYVGGNKVYNVTNPQNDAYANVDNMVNDDSYSDWGHRDNILDRNATGIGVASYYDPQTNYSTNVEDFSYGNTPQDI